MNISLLELIAEWKSFKNEDAIAQFQADAATAAPGNNDTEYLLVAAIIFEGRLDLLDKNSSSNDGSISYKLRVRKLDGRTSSFNTDYLFPVYQGPGPDKCKDNYKNACIINKILPQLTFLQFFM
ncbi:unnamed protein product [Orchesella dallaii]|uniref:Uncharacterized protein n=1 Tax=Orchesella dallaii TaxID=48710 RepID=A0ABP1Q1I7_9HEXA